MREKGDRNMREKGDRKMRGKREIERIVCIAIVSFSVLFPWLNHRKTTSILSSLRITPSSMLRDYPFS